MPRQTPFHPRTAELCTSQSWQDWSGYLAANSYDLEHIHEYNAVRTTCALFDITPLYKYHLRGRDAVRLLDRMVTRDVTKCRVGQVMYTAWCDDDGKIIDDGTIARIEDDFFRLTAAIPSVDWLEDLSLGLDVRIEDVTHAYGGLSLQGPSSRDLLQRLVGADLSGLRYFRMLEDKVAGAPARISRTGYTGDLGYEIFMEPQDALRVWDALMERGGDYGLRAAGNVALDMARVEAGLLLIDVDFHSARKTLFESQKSTPYELSLDWLVRLDKDFYIGRDALRREKGRGPASRTVGLVVDIEALERAYRHFGMPLHLPYTSWNEELPVYAAGDRRDHVGKATSGSWSPILKQYVVIARVDTPRSETGNTLHLELTVEGRRFAIPARVVTMPFFDPPRKRN